MCVAVVPSAVDGVGGVLPWFLLRVVLRRKPDRLRLRQDRRLLALYRYSFRDAHLKIATEKFCVSSEVRASELLHHYMSWRLRRLQSWRLACCLTENACRLYCKKCTFRFCLRSRIPNVFKDNKTNESTKRLLQKLLFLRLGDIT